MEITKKRDVIIAKVCVECDKDVAHLAMRMLNAGMINFYMTYICDKCLTILEEKEN